jgi:signal transduction histidine kinase
MTLKYLSRLMLLLLICVLSCSKSEQTLYTGTQKDSISYYINKASDIRVPYKIRLAYNQKAEELLIREDNDSLVIEQLHVVALNYQKLNSLEKFKKAIIIGLQKSQKQRNVSQVATSYFYLGNYYKEIRLNDSAFYFYLKAEKQFLRSKRISQLGVLYLNKSSVQIDVFDIFGAEKSAIKSLKYCKIENDKLGEYDALVNLGIASNSAEDYTKSNYYFDKALQVVKNISFAEQYFLKEILLNNKGNNYLYSREYKEAIEFFQKALRNKNIRKQDPRLYSTIIDNLGKCKFEINPNNDESLNLFLESLRIKDSMKLHSGIVFIKDHLSKYYWHKENKLKSLLYAKEALLLSRRTKNINDVLQSLKQMSIVESENYQLYMEEYISLSDSLYKKHRIARNKFAAIAYETEEINTEKNQAIQQKWIFFGIAVLVFVIGALVVLLLTQRTKQKELRFLQEQQKTNEEIYQLIQNQQTKIDEARKREKKRIAQDLHDGIMNRLSSTRLNLHILTDKATPEIIRKCLPFVAGIQDIEKEIRNVSHDLNRDAVFNKVSFVAVIETFIEDQKPLFSGNCHLEIASEINWDWLTSSQKIHIFRIIQEAFQNTVKHAQATNIIISILLIENQILLEIFDDGIGFSLKQKKKGIGLQNIFSRAKQCQGKAEINSEVGTGTTIRITIPLTPKL